MKNSVIPAICCFVVGLASVTSLSAQVAFGPEGVPLFWEQKRDYHTATELTGGGLLSVWCESNLTGSMGVALQIVTSAGEPLFGAEPLVISPQGMDAIQPRIAATSDGGAFIAWFDIPTTDRFRVKLQRLDRRGNLLYREGGIAFGEFSSELNPGIRPIPDSNGGVLLAYTENNNSPLRLLALNADGTLRQGWPDGGMRLDSTNYEDIQPDADGGFWVVRAGAYLNRLRPNGEWLWRDNVVVGPRAEYFSKTMQAIGRYLYIYQSLFWLEPSLCELSVYDGDGGQVSHDILFDREGDRFTYVVLPGRDGRLFIFYCRVEPPDRFNPDGYLVGPVYITCYDPLGGELFPWGEAGIEISAIPSATLADIGVIKIGDVILITNYNNLLILNTEGDPEWENTIERQDGFPGFLNPYQEHSEGWMYYWWGETVAQVNETGEFVFGEEPVRIVPLLPRWDNPNFAATQDGKLCMQSHDANRGFAGQTIDRDGRLSAPLDLTPLGLQGWQQDPRSGSGVLGNRQWLLTRASISDPLFIFLNSENQILDTQTVEDIYSPKFLADNGRDQLLFASTTRDGTDLHLIDSTGRRIQREPTNFADSRSEYLAGAYWPGAGWLVYWGRDYQDDVFLQLFDDNLQPLWRESLHLEQSIRAIRCEDDRVTLVDYVRDQEARNYNGLWSEVSLEGGLIRQRTATILEGVISNIFNFKSAVITPNGKTWFIIEHEGDYLLQLMDENLERCLDSCLIYENLKSVQVASDSRDGIWFFWSDRESAKVIHLDSEGRPWQNRYPSEGLNLFDVAGIRITRVFNLADSDQLWVVGLEEKYLINDVYGGSDIRGYRAQLVGDEWLVGVNEDVHSAPVVFVLNPPFPNPFNSSTTISYSLPRPGRYALDVVDIQGRLVTRLSDGWKEAGSYREVWDGKGVGSGVYFVRLSANERTTESQINLIR